MELFVIQFTFQKSLRLYISVDPLKHQAYITVCMHKYNCYGCGNYLPNLSKMASYSDILCKQFLLTMLLISTSASFLPDKQYINWNEGVFQKHATFYRGLNYILDKTYN